MLLQLHSERKLHIAACMPKTTLDETKIPRQNTRGSKLHVRSYMLIFPLRKFGFYYLVISILVCLWNASCISALFLKLTDPCTLLCLIVIGYLFRLFLWFFELFLDDFWTIFRWFFDAILDTFQKSESFDFANSKNREIKL